MAVMHPVKSKPCPSCKSVKTIYVTFDQLVKYEQGALIQNAFPDLSANDRERFITGYCQTCWDKMFKEEE